MFTGLVARARDPGRRGLHCSLREPVGSPAPSPGYSRPVLDSSTQMNAVIPAHAGIQFFSALKGNKLDARFRGHDDKTFEMRSPCRPAPGHAVFLISTLSSTPSRLCMIGLVVVYC